MRISITFIVLLFPLLILSQNHDNVWITDIDDGSIEPNAANIIDFSTYPPTISSDTLNISTYVTLASVCDADGNLIFYSNGIDVMNRNYQLMENGNDIITGEVADNFNDLGYPAIEGLLALPKPDNANQYYLIQSKEVFNTLEAVPQLFYSVIDMSLDNGKGAVTEKEQLIAETLYFDHATATKHANGRDWWVIAPHRQDTGYFSFLLAPSGITDTLTQYVSYYKPPYPDSINIIDHGGLNVFSPDGSIYVDYDISAGIRIFDFDRCSGLLSSSPTIIPYNPLNGIWFRHGWGASISLNSRFLYILKGTNTEENNLIVQYDLHATDIIGSADTVAFFDGFMSPQHNLFDISQLMPDGKIYISTYGVVDHLHYIDQPNNKGISCNVIQHGINLPNNYRWSKPHYPNYRLGPLDGSPCDSLNINNIPVAKYRYDQDTIDELKVYFTDLSYYEPADWLWDFGDNSTSTDTCPIHTFSGPGVYEVCLTVSNSNLPTGHTYCDTLSLGTVSTEEITLFETNLFPNPFHESTTLMIYDYLPQDANIVLKDATGREVFRQRIYSGSNVLRLGELPEGLYFYRVEENNITIKTGKIVKI